ncbi:DUF488 domain-containing protein [Microbacterium sp. No. 7]|uniref:DUF488 domain-containing protein n=1 Tax=Microbacterium sp. No. 7 TaxID=1714373 RepID=UPI0006D040FA|nr:DUF488 family protein [Microbacterium sp. No. 7]ALJ21677.1 hypothetical protein AOA12_17975 [Microbacterium sp. No. 7]
MELRMKRAYEPADADDGFRVLVDRLWPRGVSKERAAIDLWAKEVAPTPELRTAFHHGGLDWSAFADAYRAELAANPAVPALRETLAAHDRVTLVYAAHDEEHNHALLLRTFLEPGALASG